MKSVKVAIVVIVIAGAVLWVAAEMFLGGPVIRIENRSSMEIESVHVSGNGFDKQIARLRPGEVACVRPSGIPGESGLEFRATAGGRMIRATDIAYLEASGGYHVRVEVLPNLEVRAAYGSVWLAFCGLWP